MCLSHITRNVTLATFLLRRWNCLMRLGCYWCIWKLHRYTLYSAKLRISKLDEMSWSFLSWNSVDISILSFHISFCDVSFKIVINWYRKILWNCSVVQIIAFTKYFRTLLYANFRQIGEHSAEFWNALHYKQHLKNISWNQSKI